MKKMKGKLFAVTVGVVFLGSSAFTPAQVSADEVMWVNHLDFLAGDPSVILSFNAGDSGVGGGLSGLIINSTTAGEDDDAGWNKVIQKGLIVPPGYLVNGVRVCYELSSVDGFISQIRLAQVQDPPATASVLLDDTTDLTNPGPVCVDSSAPTFGPIDPSAGALLLSFRVNVTNPADDVTDGDTIVIRGVALNVIPQAVEDLQEQIDGLEDGLIELEDGLQNHTHEYLTGKGSGHNNTTATSGPADISEETVPEPVPFEDKKEKKQKKK